MMSGEFNFKTFVTQAKLATKSINYLTEQNLDDKFVLERLDTVRISTLDISDGDQIRLQIALDELFDRPSPAEKAPEVLIKQEPGATAGATASATVDVRPKTGLIAPKPDADPPLETTTSLAKDARLNALVEEFLNSNQRFASLKDLLSLADIKSGVENRGERPLLIGDFLHSNINFSYLESDEEVKLGSDAKIVVNKKKKPDVVDYTPELWIGANCRILNHLIDSGSDIQVIKQYSTYTSMIADFLEIYAHRGVFCLDYEHRHKVAKEGKKWDDISFHDQMRLLKYSTKSKDSLKDQPKDKSKRSKGPFQKRNKKTDSDGRPICFNFNLQKGCNYGKGCLYSHVCLTCEGNHSQTSCES